MFAATDARLLNNAELEFYRDNGYVVAADLLSAQELSDFIDSEESVDPDSGPRGLQNHNHDEAWDRVARHPNVVTIVRQLLGGRPWVLQSMYMAKQPSGGTGVALHQDTHYIRNEPNTLMACWVAFNDTGPDNGGLCVVPGSHKKGLFETDRVRESEQHTAWEKDYEMKGPDGEEWVEPMYSFDIHAYSEDEVTKLEVPAGSGVFFTSMTIHGSYANLTQDRRRLAFATHFVREGTWVYRKDLQDMVAAN
ncbi:MAG: phytanoyl-CoA dioxygenase family protein [Candidatus Latescibacterota bacterium]|nr:phytanoyl-CoA dioxygenase family protein [Candidatus Latescibacterota bacterium]